MPYLEFEELQRRLINLKSFMTWEEIHALPDFMRVPIGTLSNCMYGREPKDPITRELLNLAPDPNCGRCWRFNRYIRQAARKPTRWADMPGETLRVALEFREEMK